MKKSVRMADIAQQLGISTVSVSKALAGKPGVSEEMRTKVIALARQMGYSGTRVRYETGLTGNIGVLVSNCLFPEDSFYTNLYRELVLHSGENGYSCIMEIVSQKAEQAVVPPPLIMQQRVDGIIFMGALDSDYLKAVMDVGLPCLALDFRVPGLWIDSVRRDNTEGGFLLTKYLLSAGYKQIGFVGNIDQSDVIMERYWGYRWAMQKFGIAPRDEWFWKELNDEAGFFSASDRLPEAVVCGSNETAFHLKNIWQRSDYPNTTKIALACFDDFSVLIHSRPRLVTYQVEPKQMAETAIQHLICKMRGETSFSPGCVISGQLVMTNDLQLENQYL